MPRTVAIGVQDFSVIREKNYFYIDKTSFIKEWWEGGDNVTLITRPRRFGKTLMMSTVEQFFSVKYAGRGELFEGLEIWKEEEYCRIQGTYPVISISFANVKEKNFQATKERVYQILTDLYSQYSFLKEWDKLSDTEREYFDRVSLRMRESDATYALHKLSQLLAAYYGKKVIILLDEYDTPMQEAYVGGYWDEMTGFFRSMFNAAFKTNSWTERGILTGITRISRESVFSDLNHLEVISATSAKYAAMFGFTQEEVFAALDEFGLKSRREVKEWYYGFTFGEREDIYNPWSIINFLDKRKLASYWANTSSNGLVSKLIREANKNIKLEFERLMQGGHLLASLDEQIVYDQLEDNDEAIWSLLLACGYLKVVHGTTAKEGEDTSCLEQGYELALTNYEVKRMFSGLIRGWFGKVSYDYNDFVKALLTGDIKAMNAYMNRITMTMFSFFDTGNRPSGAEPERFYHGFVLGLLVELENRYRISSNRESGFGRYDVMMEPYSDEDWAIILEFKVHDPKKEDGLEDTIKAALLQIEVKQYEAEFMARGIKKERVRKYGFAFAGKAVLIGEG